MVTKVTFDRFTDRSVSVEWQNYVEVDGVEYPVGKPLRVAYMNSERGRAMIAEALSEQDLAVIMSMWGDVPTVTEGGD
jgi:hypothetical protein